MKNASIKSSGKRVSVTSGKAGVVAGKRVSVTSGKAGVVAAKKEIASGKRFAFGKNWERFLTNLTPTRLHQAEAYLCKMLNQKTLKGKTFLDIGCGSGLFSLAAHRLGAKTYSFDIDQECVACAKELRSRYANTNANTKPKTKPSWHIEAGSVLDDAYVAGLGTFDIVYSWGVLHHTDQMWRAIVNASRLVNRGGLFYIAIYNDQGLMSRLWWVIKYIYNRLPRLLQPAYARGLDGILVVVLSFKYALRFKLWWFLRQRLHVSKRGGVRGVKVYATEIYDWYGGFPFEFATHDHLKDFVEGLGFRYVRGVQPGSLGCNEFVFQKTPNKPRT